MTSQDFIRAEAENTDRIILYKEGLFWKAYERSAYILCMQVRPFKPTKKSLKSLDGGHIVSVGFPWKHEQKHIGALERLESGDERLTLAAASAIDPADFEAWKALLPLHTPAAPRRAGEVAAADLEPPRQAECTSPIVACMPVGHTRNDRGKIPLTTDSRFRRSERPISRSPRPASWPSASGSSIWPKAPRWSVCYSFPN